MKVGYLGIGDTSKDVAFMVSSGLIETFTNMKVKTQANYSTHKIHGGKAVPEMTGMDADQITFDMLLSAYLGVNPQKELGKLQKFMEDGTICSLVLGDQLFGTWVVKSIPYNVEYLYKEGDITQAKVSVTLLEADGPSVSISAVTSVQTYNDQNGANKTGQRNALQRRITDLERQIVQEKDSKKRAQLISQMTMLKKQLRALGG